MNKIFETQSLYTDYQARIIEEDGQVWYDSKDENEEWQRWPDPQGEFEKTCQGAQAFVDKLDRLSLHATANPTHKVDYGTDVICHDCSFREYYHQLGHNAK